MTTAYRTFERRRLVRFGDCDPAGIVFYPRYFEMLNALLEDWFGQGLGIDFAAFITERRLGLPSRAIASEFLAVSRCGETLVQRLAVKRLGRTSLTLDVRYLGVDGSERARFEQVLVCTSLATHRPEPLPADLRAALESFMTP